MLLVIPGAYSKVEYLKGGKVVALLAKKFKHRTRVEGLPGTNIPIRNK
jgi:hypothetical protein